jgi:hypothetical protein
MFRGIASLGAIREENGALAVWEEPRAEVLGRDANDVSMLPQRSIIELGEIPDAALCAGSDCGRPENAMLAEKQFSIRAFRKKPLNVVVRDTRKEEYVVKITLAREFGLPLGEPSVLD